MTDSITIELANGKQRTFTDAYVKDQGKPAVFRSAQQQADDYITACDKAGRPYRIITKETR